MPDVATLTSPVADPVLADLVLAGMRAGGQYNLIASSQAVREFLVDQFQTIKTDLTLASHSDPMLRQETCLLAFTGVRSIALPTDFETEAGPLWVHDASAGYRGNCQVSTVTKVKLAATFAAEEDAIQGRFLFLTDGPGAGEYRTIIAWDNTTKEATVNTALTTAPVVATKYLISEHQFELHRADLYQTVSFNERPKFYSRNASVSMRVAPTPDMTYPILMEYYANLTRLSEDSPTFIRHLRHYRALWFQGIKTYTMQRYEDARWQSEFKVWHDMYLSAYAGNTNRTTQVEPNR